MAASSCPACGFPIAPGDVYCSACGHRLEAPAVLSIQLEGDRRYEADPQSIRLLKGSQVEVAIPWGDVQEMGTRMAEPRGGFPLGRIPGPPRPGPGSRGLVYATFYVLYRTPRGASTLAFDQREVLPTKEQRRAIEALYPAQEGMDPPYSYLMILYALRQTQALGQGRGNFGVLDRLGSPANPH